MPRLMSVALTTQGVRERRKTVTRRLGWWRDRRGRLILSPGDHLTLVPIDVADAAPAGATTRVELSSPPVRDRPRD